MQGSPCAHTSKLWMMVTTAPPAKSMTPAMCVGVSTVMTVPFFGWLVMVRSGNVMRADPVTRFTGPSRFTRAVR